MSKGIFCLPLLIIAGLTAGHAAEVRPMNFSLYNDRPTPTREIARVSIPVPVGLMKEEPPQFVSFGARHLSAQANVITRHPDGSGRRVMLSFPVNLAAKSSRAFTYKPTGKAARLPALAQLDDRSATIQTDAFDLQFDDENWRVTSKSGTELASIDPFGPQLVAGRPPTITVIENGPFFVWLRWRQDGSDYSREVDIQADRLGRVRLAQRIVRHLKDNGWTPDFGFEFSATAVKPLSLPEKTLHFLTLPIAGPISKCPELVAALELANGAPLSMVNPLALRQHRGTLETSRSGDTTTVRFSRVEPVVKEMDNLLLQEGMWRTIEVVLQPAPPESLAASVDSPLRAKVDWQLYNQVYRTGPPLKLKSPVLKDMVEKYVTTLQALSMHGDDWGSLGGLERYNHCQYIWEDYFRTGDPRLRRVALDYSENYNDFSVYWGPNPDLYGGSRYPANNQTQPWAGSFRTRHNNAVTFCTKGYHSFWLAYEETGDTRFRYAAEQQARWSSTHVHATVNYMRCIGQVVDFVKLYEYTGDRFYLDNASRLWTEFQTCQNPDLLFNEAGVPSTGNDLYVPDDSFGYKNPYVKSYIVQYATNSLPYLLAHKPEDKRLRDTILACNDWMARVQTAAGGWSYPGPTTAGFGWNIEYCHGLMAGYSVEPKEQYINAVQRELSAIIALCEAYGAIPSGVKPWEHIAGMTNADLGNMYHLRTDRDRSRDFTDGVLQFGASPDSTVYLRALLRDYLERRTEASLFTRNEALDHVLRMPASVSRGAYRQTGDPSLRITVSSTTTPEGTKVNLKADAGYKLAGRGLTYRWVLPTGITKEGKALYCTFARRGEFEVKLLAHTGDTEYSRSVFITTPAGPGDIGLSRWPDGIRVQAESFSEQGGGATTVHVRTAAEKLGSIGGAISHWESPGSWVDWRFNVPQAGRYFVLLRYACPAVSHRLVSIEGKDLGSMNLDATGGFGSAVQDQWNVELFRDKAGQPQTVDLTAGPHTVRLANVEGKGCNLDYIDFLPAPDNRL
ncbi:MAG: hypothetical protein AUJ92_13775 [Armatimonadetes bacterium CG2_30_59_28]|nr:MAG: hypothetical protein AUJ92_13775 [Armatimonadetes bacterium CG2_30_59_28]PIU66824.1 MAG: hypothetical protein COS85_03180 [Armatimonadetes bacterium CG07_land_8_20_14_0_80_59_28]PIX40010.1 MAG: hypothetical protein COZ56_15845 [Armatimonadetes bacterium CG_4_8_14_3_um_filter_58_9]